MCKAWGKLPINPLDIKCGLIRFLTLDTIYIEFNSLIKLRDIRLRGVIPIQLGLASD